MADLQIYRQGLPHWWLQGARYILTWRVRTDTPRSATAWVGLFAQARRLRHQYLLWIKGVSNGGGLAPGTPNRERGSLHPFNMRNRRGIRAECFNFYRKGWQPTQAQRGTSHVISSL